MWILIDGHGLAYRTYFGNEKEFKKKTGEGLFGYSFLSQLQSAVAALQVDAFTGITPPKFLRVLLCWDTPSANETRRAIYPEYKTNRRKRPENLVDWVPRLIERCRSAHPRYGIAVDGMECDDVLAHLATSVLDGQRVTIVTRDRDLCQLLPIEGVRLYDPIDNCYMDRKRFLHEHGFPAYYWPIFRTVVGDSSDNWSGIPRVGEKGAQRLLAKAYESELFPQQVIWQLHEKYDPATIDLGMRLIFLPFGSLDGEGDPGPVQSQFLDALDDDRVSDWGEYFDAYRIEALDLDKVQGWLS